MTTISLDEALRMVSGSSKFDHSVLVSKIMKILAVELGEDAVEWEIVGLLHDLDYDLVQGDRSLHGIRASELLRGKLTDRGLHAIKAHDHRTGLKLETLLDESLRFADSLAIFTEDQEFPFSEDMRSLEGKLQQETQIKPWITKYISKYRALNRIALEKILIEI